MEKSHFLRYTQIHAYGYYVIRIDKLSSSAVYLLNIRKEQPYSEKKKKKTYKFNSCSDFVSDIIFLLCTFQSFSLL